MNRSKDDCQLFCFGYGYSCDGLGQALMAQGWNVAGTTREREKWRFLKTLGIKSFLFDYEQPLEDPALFLRGTTHLLISTPPSDDGDPAFLMHGQDVLNIPTIRWVGYLSSTSVYGDREGGWVDENSEVRPSSIRGSRRARAEEQWLSLYRKHKLPVHIFRLAGIYGPGRSALDSVRAGIARRINKPGHAFSRIHIDDIVQTLIASMNRPNPGAVYNVADDLAAPSHEVILRACEMLGLTPPPLIPYEEADVAPITRSFYSDNKRIRNDRIKNELGVVLRYPTFIEGLQGCLEAERAYHERLGDFADAGEARG
jgi:hypothetical protein